MEYKVLPFITSINPNKGTTNHVAEQLGEILAEHSRMGWEYVRLENVSSFVQPTNGCFGMGSTPGYYTTRQIIIFSKK
ncbi:hypothetical protein [uncultured Kriegella sp.]|uniref:hypothetical protein n=1 Tax=uncultured Kriegella sp. TaxID=1798910 RepID=UPI0030DA0751|tara:strand:+ start:37677 stop:37910 length:234 start_codon:yes stop_codon:yes gene_type:complete